MIVTSRARRRDSKERLTQGRDLIVREIDSKLLWVSFVDRILSDRQKRRRRKLLGLLCRVFGGKQIASDLLTQKLVERFVLEKRFDDIVAITPRMRIDQIHVFAR